MSRNNLIKIKEKLSKATPQSNSTLKVDKIKN